MAKPRGSGRSALTAKFYRVTEYRQPLTKIPSTTANAKRHTLRVTLVRAPLWPPYEQRRDKCGETSVMTATFTKSGAAAC